MKSGSNFIVSISSDIDIANVDKVIFTLKGVETLTKVYPDNVNYSEEHFWIPLTQEDTLALSTERDGRKIFCEAQFNFSDKAVTKSNIFDFFLKPSLATELVEGNTPSGENMKNIVLGYEDGIVIAKVDLKDIDDKIREEVEKYIGDIDETLAKKVDKEDGKSLISDEEIERLANVDNYDDTDIREELANKVDKVEGKSLMDNTEIERLKDVDNYDDTAVKKSISDVDKKVDDVEEKIPSLDGYATEQYVDNKIDELPQPMVFKGSLGVGGTITSLPTATKANEGFTYKVITDGTYASQSAKVGDVFISNGSAWTLIPSGDDPSGTVMSVGLEAPTGFSVEGSPVTSSGNLKLKMASGYSVPTTAKQSEWDAKSNFSGNYNDLTNKPTIPTKLSQLESDSTHRTVTDSEKAKWNANQGNVTSVNGKDGAVVLNAADVHAIPDSVKVVTSTKQGTAGTPSMGGVGISYSTEEQDTGLTWIDGRKMYQRTIQFSGLQNEQTHNNVVEGEIILVKDGFFENSSGYRFPISTNWTNGNQNVYLLYTGSTILTRVNSGATYSANITVLYAK